MTEEERKAAQAHLLEHYCKVLVGEAHNADMDFYTSSRLDGEARERIKRDASETMYYAQMIIDLIDGWQDE